MDLLPSNCAIWHSFIFLRMIIVLWYFTYFYNSSILNENRIK